MFQSLIQKDIVNKYISNKYNSTQKTSLKEKALKEKKTPTFFFTKKNTCTEFFLLMKIRAKQLIFILFSNAIRDGTSTGLNVSQDTS